MRHGEPRRWLNTYHATIVFWHKQIDLPIYQAPTLANQSINQNIISVSRKNIVPLQVVSHHLNVRSTYKQPCEAHLIRKALYINKDREGYRTPYWERDHRFYVVGRYRRSSGVVKPASEARAVSAVADGVGCGLCAPAARGRGQQREHRAERQHRRWYCTAEYCGRGGSRHFREIEEKSPGYLVFVSATLLICLPFKKIVWMKWRPQAASETSTL